MTAERCETGEEDLRSTNSSDCHADGAPRPTVTSHFYDVIDRRQSGDSERQRLVSNHLQFQRSRFSDFAKCCVCGVGLR